MSKREGDATVAGWEDLPLEMQVLIFSNLPPNTLFKCFQVCSSWYESCCAPPLIFTPLCSTGIQAHKTTPYGRGYSRSTFKDILYPLREKKGPGISKHPRWLAVFPQLAGILRARQARLSSQKETKQSPERAQKEARNTPRRSPFCQSTRGKSKNWLSS